MVALFRLRLPVDDYTSLALKTIFCTASTHYPRRSHYFIDGKIIVIREPLNDQTFAKWND